MAGLVGVNARSSINRLCCVFLAEISQRIGTLAVISLYMALSGSQVAGPILVGYSYATLAFIIIDLGLGLYGTKLVASAPRVSGDARRDITLARLSVALIVVPGYIFFMPDLSEMGLAATAGFAVFILGRAIACDWFFKGKEQFGLLGWLNGVGALAQIAVGLGVAVGFFGELFSTLPWAVYSVVLCIGTWRFGGAHSGITSKSAGPPRLGRIFLHAKKSFQFCLGNGLSVFFQQSPILVLSFFKAAPEFAVFAFVHRIALSSTFIFQVLGTAIFPQLVRAGQFSVVQVKQLAVRYIARVTAFAMALLAAFYGIALWFSYGSRLDGVEKNFDILALFGSYVAVRGVRVVPFRILSATGEQRTFTKIIAIFFFSYILGCGVLVNTGNLNSLAVVVLFLVVEVGILLASLRVVFKLKEVTRE